MGVQITDVEDVEAGLINTFIQIVFFYMMLRGWV